MTNLFIDTNVFLSFFIFSTDHLGKLENLKELIKKKEILLFLPDQVVDEFNRNREAKLKTAIDHLEKLVPKLQTPAFCRDFQEMKEIQKHVEEIRKFIDSLVAVLKKQINSRTLQADKLISEIFSLGMRISIPVALLDASRGRFDRGNPPGKDGSYGDAINWETLLAVCPQKEDLYFVGGDKDFRSILNSAEFSPFLTEEWQRKKESKVLYYELISEFIKQKFAQIRITEDQIKEEKEAAKQISTTPFPGTLGLTGYSGLTGFSGYGTQTAELNRFAEAFAPQPIDPAFLQALLKILAQVPKETPKK